MKNLKMKMLTIQQILNSFHIFATFSLKTSIFEGSFQKQLHVGDEETDAKN